MEATMPSWQECALYAQRERSLPTLSADAWNRSLGRLTLRAGEGAILGTLGESAVEEGGELSILDVLDGEVEAKELLEDLTTVEETRRLARCIEQAVTAAGRFGSRGGGEVEFYLRATVAFLEL